MNQMKVWWYVVETNLYNMKTCFRKSYLADLSQRRVEYEPFWPLYAQL